MNWVKGVVFSFVFFVLFVGTMVFIMMNQHIDLVRGDYYQMDLTYQLQLDRKNNVLLLQNKPKISVNRNWQMSLVFPYDNTVSIDQIEVYRPHDERLDERYKFKEVKNNRVIFGLKHKVPGACRVRVWWRMDGKEYYYEEKVVL